MHIDFYAFAPAVSLASRPEASVDVLLSYQAAETMVLSLLDLTFVHAIGPFEATYAAGSLRCDCKVSCALYFDLEIVGVLKCSSVPDSVYRVTHIVSLLFSWLV